MRRDETHPLERDLEDIVARNADDFAHLRGARLFVTGGTGFVGSWLLESLAWANRRLALQTRAVVLTRDPDAFSQVAPHLARDPALEFVRGDVRELGDVAGSFDAVLHAAAPASAPSGDEQPQFMLETVVDGTLRVLDLARRSGPISVLFASSGAVYGPQPPDLELVDEAYAGGPDTLDPRNAYHESKRAAELACAVAGATYGLEPKIARLFAFVGPYLPLDRNFAIGNFIRDALRGTPIEISSDGTPIRTYLYSADMTSWLWRILVRGAPSRAYNVGSERTMSIRETAAAVAANVERPGTFVVKGEPAGGLPQRYACATERARSELDLDEWTALPEAIRRTIAWHRVTGSFR